MEDKKKIITALLIVWALIALYYLVSYIFSEPPTSVKTTQRQASSKAAATVKASDLGKLRLDLLEKTPAVYTGIKRDIFSPVKVRRPKPKPPKPKPKPVPLPVVKPPPPTPAVKMFVRSAKFVGFVMSGTELTAFLSRGDDIFLVKRGELVDRRFKVISITSTVLKFSDLTTGETASIVVPED
ncbi:MAG: hypothetical protein KAT46_00405 [Deltaproteobacteria bacterium]|nr:hypothetical protein [Deltaproteobacteria bacterium]